MSRIKELRKQKKISQEKLAKELNVHQTAVSQWEQGRTTPDSQLLPNIAKYFNVSTDYILGITDFRDDVNQKLCYILAEAEFNSPKHRHGQNVAPFIPKDIIDKIKNDTYRFTHESLEGICLNVGLDKDEVLRSATTRELPNELDSFSYALLEETRDLTNEEKEKVIDFIRFIKSQRFRHADSEAYIAATGGHVSVPGSEETPESARKIIDETFDDEE